MPVLVTQEGVTRSQPSVSVSTSSPVYDDAGNVVGGARLNVCRYYDTLRNEWGGHGVTKPLDHDGLVFATPDEARAFARSHGYLRPHFSPPAARQHRKERAHRPAPLTRPC